MYFRSIFIIFFFASSSSTSQLQVGGEGIL